MMILSRVMQLNPHYVLRKRFANDDHNPFKLTVR